MRLGAAIVLAAGAACFGDERTRACGDWPAQAVGPVSHERTLEYVYVSWLVDYDLSRRSAWQVFVAVFPEWGLAFFIPGETLVILRPGEVSPHTVLVRTAGGSRYWTTWEETACR